MTLEEYINTNLSNAILRGLTKDGELTVRLKEISGKNLKVTFLSFVSIPEILRIDVPIEGFVLTFVGKFLKSEEDVYVYTAFDKAGIVQRRAKQRYVAFEHCRIFGFNSLIIDISENGCQIISLYKPRLKEEIEITLDCGDTIKGIVMWYVEEEECFKYGVYIPNPNDLWLSICEKYVKVGEII
ncbi:MAG: PilZ domain-containing protein [Fervidobacterium sp.]